jgi:hypothetical protein
MPSEKSQQQIKKALESLNLIRPNLINEAIADQEVVLY